LLVAAIGEKRHVAMPMGKRTIRVLDVVKTQPRFSSATPQLPAPLTDAPVTNESASVCHA
jgi:hypothetical protein